VDATPTGSCGGVLWMVPGVCDPGLWDGYAPHTSRMCIRWMRWRTIYSRENIMMPPHTSNLLHSVGVQKKVGGDVLGSATPGYGMGMLRIPHECASDGCGGERFTPVRI